VKSRANRFSAIGLPCAESVVRGRRFLGDLPRKATVQTGEAQEICRRHYAALVPESMAMEVNFGDEVLGHPPFGIAMT